MGVRSKRRSKYFEMTELLLIRHGETLWNQQRRMQGQNDSPLTPTGLEQARKLARRLKDVAFSALYSSDLRRAHETARCIADATGHEVIADRGLRERSFGIFEGLTNDEIRARHPEDYVLFDNFFASAHGPSFPNHLYTIAAQSGGAHDNPTIPLDLLRDLHIVDTPGTNSIERMEEALAPFDPRPHWGKLFTLAPAVLRSRIERRSDFTALADRHDPGGKFRNAFLNEFVF